MAVAATATASAPRWRRPSTGSASTSTSSVLTAAPPETDDEFAELYAERIAAQQQRQLFPLMEDLADWINGTLGADVVTGGNFMDALDNGVLVCHLARVIADKAKHAVESGAARGPAPVIKGRCFEKAARRSFFSRDNTDNFIQFCRQLGVHQNLLFESDDLVLHARPRHVVLCLLEVSRLAAARFGVEAAGLVELEREIAAEEANANAAGDSLLSWQFESMRHSASAGALRAATTAPSSPSPPPQSTASTPTRTRPPRPRPRSAMLPRPPETAPGGSDGVPSDHTEDEWSRASGSGSCGSDDVDTGASTEVSVTGGDAMSELDRKVQIATRAAQRRCRCDRLGVRKVGEGRYCIAGKNVFVRLLKGRHMMVRVGGGWDTLEHFLQRHDPCQVRLLSRCGSPGRALPTSPPSTPLLAASSLAALADSVDANPRHYLHIRAKYRSPAVPVSPAR